MSLQPLLNPIELVSMSSRDVQMFRRLQVSANFLLGNRNKLTELHDQWFDRIKPLKSIQISSSAKNPLNWSCDEVVKFVSQINNCSTIATIFAEHEIDGLAFLQLRQNDMIDIMGLSLGSAIKISNHIVALQEECNTNYIQYG